MEDGMRASILTNDDLVVLQKNLAIAELSEEYRSDASEPERLRLLLMRMGHVKVQMYLERGPHKRPHFHLEYKHQFRASYAIDTLERIVGYMPRKYGAAVLEWASTVQPRLAQCWEALAKGRAPLALELEPPTPTEA